MLPRYARRLRGVRDQPAQVEGIAKAKEAGVYKGRKRSADIDAVRALKAEGSARLLLLNASA
jgi:hypothetical protein